MLYDDNIKDTMVDTLTNKVLTIVDTFQTLLKEGYLPGNAKNNNLSWYLILIHAYENIDVLEEDQHVKLDRLYNKILKV